MIKKTPLSQNQDRAANPQENVWVQANAGTGKTSVLIQRLLRILFRTPDVKKSGILCLTYTNAAAGEMRNRILGELKKWALFSDEDLRELLDGVAFNKQVTDQEISHAREIFFTYIDNPDMLKIKTIHGFCEEILHRFPVEAHVSPAWKLISGADQQVLLWDAFNNMISNAKSDNTDAAFSRIVNRISEYVMDDLLQILGRHYKDFFAITNIVKYREYFIERTGKFLQINNNINTEKPVKNLSVLVEMARDKNAKSPKKYLEKIIEYTTDYIDGKIDFDEYKYAYLTQEGNKANNVSKVDFLIAEQERVFQIHTYSENKKVFDDTIALFDLSAAFAQSYMDIKRARNLLDFEDLILYTRRLFSDSETMGWVLSQMDVSLSHILVDEAQDTGPLQWDIINMLTTDFFDEGDKTEMPRSLFVVGDTKQSIYGFQGADPNAFIKSRDDIARQIENNYRVIRDIPLSQNFRSLASVLYAVDTFFNDETVKNISGFINQDHKCCRPKQTGVGVVELHRLISKKEQEQDVRDYVRNISDKIQELLNSGKYTPNDIMILVQRRHPFADALIMELKRRNIDVAGSDRIKLPLFPAVRDLLNLIRFCLDTTDDYSLCCVLKSPLYRFNEQNIYELCTLKNNAEKQAKLSGNDAAIPTVFDVLAEFDNDVYQDLLNIVNNSKQLAPYSFFTYVLRNNNSRQKMIAALGNQIIDPLEEFMTICLAYERTQSGTLHEFLKWFITGGSEVERDMDSAPGVRVVTVHGSKGLEAPVVFLIDTARTPKMDKILQLPIEKNLEFPLPWIWCVSSKTRTQAVSMAVDACQDLQIAEYYRLLYVAMTRARDELYIYGYTPDKTSNELSWYTHLWRVFSGLYNVSDNQEYIRIQHEQPSE